MEPRFAVGLDFGTTFSGFAHARTDHPDQIYLVYDYPLSAVAGQPYCKTKTAVHYVKAESLNEYKLQAWGWPAIVEHSEAVHNFRSKGGSCDLSSEAAVGHVFTRFKLQLAPRADADYYDLYSVGALASTELLPPGLTADRVITDYLREMGAFVLTELRSMYGQHVTMDEIVWALTVPAMWDDRAKQRMKRIAEKAGLVRSPRGETDNGGSLHPLHIVLEPEAASICCLQKQAVSLAEGDHVLIVDAGGGTVDLVMHRKMGGGSELNVREVTQSSGELCGSTFVDAAFLELLGTRIGCLSDFLATNPSTKLSLMRNWDYIKCNFSGKSKATILELPAKLAAAWEAYDRDNAIGASRSGSHDEIVLTSSILRSFFDPSVDKILNLVDKQLEASPETCKALLVVGGFSQSHYLMEKICEVFGHVVSTIINPPNPGAAICYGAVLHALQPALVCSRISRKTYGTTTCMPFRDGIDPVEKLIINDGKKWCCDRFSVFVKKGEVVGMNAEVTHFNLPLFAGVPVIEMSVVSTNSSSPTYIDEEGVEKEGSIIVDLRHPLNWTFIVPTIEVTMFFGRTSIEVRAKSDLGEEVVKHSLAFESTA